MIERTRLGAYLRAATENPALVQAFGINVPRMITLTYGFGVGLAALAGVLAAPIYQVSPLMGADLIIVVFAVVVIGGMGSIMGSIVTGFGLGVVEGLHQGLLSRGVEHRDLRHHGDRAAGAAGRPLRAHRRDDDGTVEYAAAAIARVMTGAPVAQVAAFARDDRRCWSSRRSSCYPVFLMKALCFALFACAFNLLIGYVGLLVVRPRRLSRLGGLRRGALRQGLGLPAGAGDPLRHRGRAPCSAWSSGALAIRRQGIYFANITLALAQMIYFFCLQAPFTGGEDGIQSVPRGTLLGVSTCDSPARSTSSCSRSSSPGFLDHLPRDPLAVRPGAEGHPRERAARRSRSATAPSATSCSRSCSRPRFAGPRRRDQGALVFQLASLTDVHWTMSGEVVLMTLLGGLGTVFGPVVGAFIVVGARELPGAARRVGHRRAGRDLRRLRAHVPSRRRR